MSLKTAILAYPSFRGSACIGDLGCHNPGWDCYDAVTDYHDNLIDATACPRFVTGTMSPHPTVVRVMIAQ